MTAPHPAAPAPGDSIPAAEPLKSHSEFYQLPSARWWKGIVTILGIGVALIIASLVFPTIAALIDLATGQFDVEAAMENKVSMTPLMLLATNLTLIATVVAAFLFHRFLHRQPIGYLHSVTGRFRWSWLAWSLIPIGIGFVIYIGFLGLGLFGGTYEPFGAPTLIAYLAIILLTTPFQAAAEEYIFRGVIQRVAGSWVRGRTASLALGTAVSAVLFTLAHGASDPWLILYYFVFGVFLSILAHYSGGLEAPILIHALNNMAMFGAAAISGQLREPLDRSVGSGGPVMLIPMAAILIIAGAALILARMRRVTMLAPAVEIPPRGTVAPAPMAPPAQQWGQQAPPPLSPDHYDSQQPPAAEAPQPGQFGAAWTDERR